MTIAFLLNKFVSCRQIPDAVQLHKRLSLNFTNFSRSYAHYISQSAAKRLFQVHCAVPTIAVSVTLHRKSMFYLTVQRTIDSFLRFITSRNATIA